MSFQWFFFLLILVSVVIVGILSFISHDMLHLFKCTFSWFSEFLPGRCFVCVCLVIQPCPTLCSPTDCRLLDSSVGGISQARRMSRLPSPSPGDLPHPGIEPHVLPLLHWQAEHAFKKARRALPAIFQRCHKGARMSWLMLWSANNGKRKEVNDRFQSGHAPKSSSGF